MAEAKIDIVVTGQNELEAMRDRLKQVSEETKEWSQDQKEATKNSNDLNDSLKKGAIIIASWAGTFVVAKKLGTALKRLGEIGADYGKTTEQISAGLKAQELAYESLYAKISDSLGLTDIIVENRERELLGLQRLTSWITGQTIPALQAEQEAILNSEKAWESRGKAIASSLDAWSNKYDKINDATKEAIRLQAEWEGVQNRKVKAHKEELKVLQELLYIYEEQGRDTSELITKIEKLEQVDVLHKQTIREKAEELANLTNEVKSAKEATDEYTSSVEENTSSIEENKQSSGGNNGSYSVTTSGGSTPQSIQKQTDEANYLQLHGYNAEADAIRDRINKQMLRELQDLNDAVRGN